jgi:septin family protein
LAVIGSSDIVKIGNKLTRGRHYEWGTVSVENESHCDFLKLKEMLLSTNMLDLIELTHTKHYQLYRANRLNEIGFRDDDDLESDHLSSATTTTTTTTTTTINGNQSTSSLSTKSSNSIQSQNQTVRPKTIQDVYNMKRVDLNEEIQRREIEIKEEFVKKVKEKEHELREAEKEVYSKLNF